MQRLLCSDCYAEIVVLGLCCAEIVMQRLLCRDCYAQIVMLRLLC